MKTDDGWWDNKLPVHHGANDFKNSWTYKFDVEPDGGADSKWVSVGVKNNGQWEMWSDKTIGTWDATPITVRTLAEAKAVAIALYYME